MLFRLSSRFVVGGGVLGRTSLGVGALVGRKRHHLVDGDEGVARRGLVGLLHRGCLIQN